MFKHNAAYMKPSEDAAVEEVSRNPTGCARSEGALAQSLTRTSSHYLHTVTIIG